MLATKRSAGVTPEVNLRNPLHAGGFGTQGRGHQQPKTGVSVTPQKKTYLFEINKKRFGSDDLPY